MNGHGAANGTHRNGVTVPKMNGKATYAEKHQIADHFIGGNKLENAPPSKVKDFVTSHDGHTVITNVRTWFPPPTSPIPFRLLYSRCQPLMDAQSDLGGVPRRS